MCLVLLLLFTVVPLLELAILIGLASIVGIWPAILIVIAFSLFGTLVARWQGVRALRGFRQAVANSQEPSREVLDAFLILAAGLLLIIPGLLTDALGLVLLTPIGRSAASFWIFRSMRRGLERGSMRVHVQTRSQWMPEHLDEPPHLKSFDDDASGPIRLPPPTED